MYIIQDFWRSNSSARPGPCPFRSRCLLAGSWRREMMATAAPSRPSRVSPPCIQQLRAYVNRLQSCILELLHVQVVLHGRSGNQSAHRVNFLAPRSLCYSSICMYAFQNTKTAQQHTIHARLHIRIADSCAFVLCVLTTSFDQKKNDCFFSRLI